MINKDSKIFLTYSLGGKYLLNAGKYDIIKDKLLCRKSPEYSKCTQKVTLEYSFIKNILSPPEKPEDMSWGRFLSTSEGKLHQKWKKLSQKEIVSYRLWQYVKDLGGIEFTYELI